MDIDLLNLTDIQKGCLAIAAAIAIGLFSALFSGNITRWFNRRQVIKELDEPWSELHSLAKKTKMAEKGRVVRWRC